MQIHELNNFTGTLGAGAYLAVDDGNDTGKLSTQQLLAATEARIDNIIAGPAPSAQEVTDARLGADGVVYPSLGDAIRDQVSDLKSDNDYIYNTFADSIGLAENYFDPREITVSNTNNWTILSRTMSGFKVQHNNTYGGGAPVCTKTLGAGAYVFHADFTNSTKKTITLYKDGTYSAEMSDGWVFYTTADTVCEFIFSPASAGTFEITNISVKKQGVENYIEQLLKKNLVSMSGQQKPIIINGGNRTITFPNKLYINHNGDNYAISVSDDFVFDYKGNGSYTLKTIYFDTTKLSDAVANGLSNDCFYVREYTHSLPLDMFRYALIAIIPDSFIVINVKPYTTFDYITNVEANRSAILANGFVGAIPQVQALAGDDKLIDADAYDQFDNLVALWDSLMARANQYGTYVSKCWIDGTAYDDTEKIMSDAPTSGDHNPRGDMNQYPLLMYKFIPARYSTSYQFKPVTRKILIVSGVHGPASGGDQLESPIAVYYFAKRLVEQFYDADSLINIRNNYEVDFIPLANPWGINNKTRANGQSIDINRDYGNFSTVTAQQIKTLLDSGEYDFALDSHCLGGTSLIEGDLAGANFFFLSSNALIKVLGYQIANYIGARYSLATNVDNNGANTMAWYGNSIGVPSALTEIPANTPLYYGDTIGEVHGQEVVKRDVDYIQNVLAVICDFIKNLNV